jgi:hypothetical protein
MCYTPILLLQGAKVMQKRETITMATLKGGGMEKEEH